MRLVVVVDEFGNGSVVAAAEHARGSGLGFNCGGRQSTRTYVISGLYLHFFS